jgi:protoporphyrinogen IX oxidase
MDSLYLLLKFLHVAAVIVWVGGVFSLAVLNARLARLGDPAVQAAMGLQSEAFGRTVVGPAMAVTLIAGLWMAGQFGIPFTSLWIVWGLVGFAGFVLIGVIAVSRVAAELGALARSAGPEDPRVAALGRRLGALSAINLLLLASVVWAMVFKPTL